MHVSFTLTTNIHNTCVRKQPLVSLGKLCLVVWFEYALMVGLGTLCSNSSFGWFGESLIALGWFGESLIALGWFGESLIALGWFGESLIALGWFGELCLIALVGLGKLCFVSPWLVWGSFVW